MGVYDFLANGETKAGTSCSCFGFAALSKFFENRFQFFLRNADALITDLDFDI